MMLQAPSGQAASVHCRKCGASIPPGRTDCVCCGERVPGESFLGRIFKRLFEWGVQSGAIKFTCLPSDGQTVVERKVYKSWEEVPEEMKKNFPPEVRQEMAAKLRQSARQAEPREVGPDGIVVNRVGVSKTLDSKINSIRFGP